MAKHFVVAMRFLAVLLFAVFAVALAKYKGGKDLDPDADLRIGVKYKPEGCTVFAAKGDKLSMEYTGTLYKDGSQFDSSVGRAPFDFTLGQGMVIKGWDAGLIGVTPGEKCVVPELRRN